MALWLPPSAKKLLPALLLIGIAGACCGTSPIQAEPVLLLLHDGRALLGEPDPATSSQRVWIYRSSANLLLRSSFAWTDVSAAEIGGEPLSVRQLQQRLIGIPLPEPLVPPPAPVKVEPVAASPCREVQRRVASLQIAATLANWDNDAALDGLEVWIQPFDHVGVPVAVDGQLELTLFGQRGLLQPFTHFAVPPTQFPELERRSYLVSRRHFGLQGAVYRLEFDSFYPERDLSIAPEGFLHARLGIAGQGVYEANQPRVLLRPVVPFRDALQLQTGRRIFPREWREAGLP